MSCSLKGRVSTGKSQKGDSSPGSPKNLGRLKRGLKRETLSFGEIAQRLGYTRQHIAKVFRDPESTASLSLLQDLQKLLNCETVDEVLVLIKKVQRHSIKHGRAAKVPVQSSTGTDKRQK